MKKRISIAFFIEIIFSLFSCKPQKNKLPKGFVYVEKYIPDLIVDLRYFSSNNFTGRPVEGYESSVLILSYKATLALKNVQEQLKNKGLGLKVFDAYRPQRAVNSFEVWSKKSEDVIAKKEFYPNVNKRDVFALNYLALKSGHTRGSTIDLTLVNLKTGQELDRGSPFDFFGSISYYDTLQINALQKNNRKILKEVMLDNHFKEYPEEWWHFTLIDEPFPETYFDFPIK
ncbi:M15 family metallopeptidase [Chryseobacterium fistulae]|uniref:D-alanyl-D-alanine dipeptidase n=1 Tax=Chryseobacterium fistulae TaxID=2675058 RepID=A0A6N4XRI4_9FLAO|nr:M15 family metallopeptidase [Chryseobacterium fistulae]CAA7386020.1 D-alanyl-D-alanine dipeptidase [Chryseobacterium fistulae]